MDTVTEKRVLRTVEFNEKNIAKQQKILSSKWLLRFGMLYSLPLGFLTGMHITKMDDECCEVSVKYKYFNKNPFKTTYWAVLGMAAEMASGIILVNYAKNVSPSVATYVVGCDSKFVNRALGVTTFKCDEARLIKEKVELAAATGEGHTFKTSTNGYSKNGTLVAEFVFTWSVKGRDK